LSIVREKVQKNSKSRRFWDESINWKKGTALVPVKWMSPEAFTDGVFTSKTDVRYQLMTNCWADDSRSRPNFTTIKETLTSIEQNNLEQYAAKQNIDTGFGIQTNDDQTRTGQNLTMSSNSCYITNNFDTKEGRNGNINKNGSEFRCSGRIWANNYYIDCKLRQYNPTWRLECWISRLNDFTL
ncbi:hypothetical protein AM593_00999, partial [Mytilus galloprovincialis]